MQSKKYIKIYDHRSAGKILLDFDVEIKKAQQTDNQLSI